MKWSEIKKGILISIIVSALATAPRIIRLNKDDLHFLLNHFLYLFVLTLLYWILSQFFVYKKKKVVLYTAIFLFISGLISIFYQLSLELFFGEFKILYSDFPLIRDLNEKRQIMMLFFRGILFAAIIYFVVFYLNLLYEKQHALTEIEQLKKEKLEAQLDSLKQQISPHFLFNSLSTLRTMVTDESSKVYINKLSNVYRYLLSLSDSNLTSLKEELNFIESYLHIVKERFEDAIQVTIKISDEVLIKQVPPLVIQLLIENAIKHNVISFEDPLHIEIFDENGLLFVRNNYQPKTSVEKSTGKGLKNIEKRYEYLSEQEIKIEVSEAFFTVKLPLL
ncbi:MAG: histidine kinase [Flavobacterium sp.]|nr:histidine kinase [Flavobacterium sp.]